MHACSYVQMFDAGLPISCERECFITFALTNKEKHQYPYVYKIDIIGIDIFHGPCWFQCESLINWFKKHIDTTSQLKNEPAV
jgi:hypothetical protein